MGLRQSDITPVGRLTPITPVSKPQESIVFQSARTDTAVVTKRLLPAQVSVVGVKIFGSTNSNAGTTATLTINLIENGVTISTGVVNLLTGGATTAEVQMSNLPNLEIHDGSAGRRDTIVQAIYAETGTASTAGGPWFVKIDFL